MSFGTLSSRWEETRPLILRSVFCGCHHRAAHSLWLVFLSSCPDITPLPWWRSGPDYCDCGRRQSLTIHFRHCLLPLRSALTGLFKSLRNWTTEGACFLSPDSTPYSPWISFKLKPYEMQVHWETPKPARFRQQNFFSKDNTVEQRVDCCCLCRRRFSSAGRFICI